MLLWSGTTQAICISRKLSGNRSVIRMQEQMTVVQELRAQAKQISKLGKNQTSALKAHLKL